MTFRSLGATVLILLACSPGPSQAQQQSQQEVPRQSTAPSPPPAPGIDASKLPLNLTRLQQKLNTAAAKPDASRLRFSIDVVGYAPRLQLLTAQDDLLYAPVPWSGPTHKDMMTITTPQEFRSPVMDFSNLMRWIQNRSKSKD